MTLPDTEWPRTAMSTRRSASSRPTSSRPKPPRPATQPQLYFKTLPDFVEQFLTKAYRRHIAANQPWCSEWWKHGEAVCVLSALWRAWEALRLEPGTGMSVWWRDHCYPHMAKLMDRDGTFKNCTRGQHHEHGALEPLPWSTPPPELYEPLTNGA